MILFLTGYRGSGKTLIGRLTAQRLGCPWLDADALIEQSSGRTVAGIFEERGEAGFRQFEEQAIQATVERAGPAGSVPRLVFSLGGGAVLNPRVRESLAASGKCVWLRADPEILIDRLSRTVGNRQRPPLTEQSLDGEVRTLLARREPVYAECADYEIDTGRCTPEEAADRIAQWVGQVDK